MDLKLVEVSGRRLLKTFIYLPGRLYADWKNWVPPLYQDEWNFHDPGHNAALAYSDVIRYILFRDGEPVGRIMGIINRKYNEQHGEKTVRFYQFDCINDKAIARELIKSIETWGQHHGLTKIIGPYGFSDKDPQGLQIEGFDHLPVIATPVNPPYLQPLLEDLGFQKDIDCVSYRFPIPSKLPALYQRVYDRIQRKANIRLIEFKNKKQLKPYIVPVFRLVNETYAPLFGFVPMSEQEIQKFAAQYLPVLDPQFVKVITSGEGDIIAFVVAMPDMSRGMQRAKGKLFPFGFIHILRAMSKTRQLNLLLGAVAAKYRNAGITVVLGKSLFDTALSRGLEFIDSHLILETNHRMKAECENLDGTLYKRYRIYQKTLS